MSRDYKREYQEYQGTPQQKHNRALRNKARREFVQEGKVHKGDGKDVDHIHPLIEGGSGAESNLRVRSVHANRGYRRDAKGRPL